MPHLVKSGSASLNGCNVNYISRFGTFTFAIEMQRCPLIVKIFFCSNLMYFGALNELGKYLLLFLNISLCFDFQNKVQIVFT